MAGESSARYREQLGSLFWLVAGIALGSSAQFYFLKKLPLLDGLVLYGLAVFCFLRSVQGRFLDGPIRRGSEERDVTPSAKNPGVLHWMVLAGVLAFALVLRVYQLSSVPYGLWYDESNAGLEASRILNDPSYRPLYAQSTTSPAAYVYLMALSEKFLGHTVLGVRMVSAAFGFLGVLTFYLLARLLLSPNLALGAAFLMAVSRWDVNFSRLGMQGITAPFFTIATVACLWWALRSGRKLYFALAGVLLGGGIWFYTALLLFPAVVGVYLVWEAFQDWGYVKRSWRGLVFMGAMAAVVVAPVAFYARQNPDTFFNRMGVASVFKGKSTEEAFEAVRNNLQKHLLMFNYRGDPNGRHNLPGEPMLDFGTSVAAVLGFGYSVQRWRQPAHFLLLAWFWVMLVPGVFSLEFEAPQALRAIGVLPPLYLFISFALEVVYNRIKSGWGEGLALGLLLLFLAGVGYINYEGYFHRQAASLPSWSAFSTPETVVGYRLRELPAGRYDVLVSQFYRGHPSVEFLGGTPYQTFDPSIGLPLKTRKEGVALFLSPKEKASYLQLRSYYPKAECDDILPPTGSPPILYYCRVSKEEIRAIQGLEARYYPSPWQGQAPPKLGKMPTLDFRWGNDVPFSTPFLALGSGVLYVPQYGKYRFVLEGSLARVYIDETMVMNGETDREKELTLAQGSHAFQIVVEASAPEGMVRLLWQPPGGDKQAIPPDILYGPTVTPSGLAGRYFPSPQWGGEPAFVRVDPAVDFYFHLVPLPRPYSVEWIGSLYAPREGTYRLGTESISSSQIYIRDQLLVDNPRHNTYVEGEVYLPEGWHPIRVRFQDKDGYSHIYLYWVPPGKEKELVPSGNLRPW